MESNFIIRIILVVSVTFIFLIGFVSTCTMYESHLIAEMTKNGVNPLQARCSINPGSSSTVCALAGSAK